MASEEHSRFREDLAAYALGALEAEHVAALEAHLRTCEACQAELADYRTIGENLPAALPPRQPPPALREQLQRRLPSLVFADRAETPVLRNRHGDSSGVRGAARLAD